VLLQIYRRGVAYFPSRHATIAQDITSDFDPLQLLSSRLSDEGIALEAWVNCNNLGNRPDPALLRALGKESLVHDHCGVAVSAEHPLFAPRGEVSAPYSLDTPGTWIDPSSGLHRERLRTLVDEISARYPLVSGVHLDFIRYPYVLPIRPGAGVSCGLDLGYGPALMRFLHDEGLNGLSLENLFNSPGEWREPSLALRFDNWRRSQITTLVQTLRGALQPHHCLSAAVLTWSERAYLTALQDWRGWLEQGLIKRAMLMSYTADDSHFRLMLKSALPFQTENTAVYAGIGCYKLRSLQDLTAQIEIAQHLGLSGAVLFSYGGLANCGL
jgi:uncharacterized lipoprotein YddW (UPF0748 family)